MPGASHGTAPHDAFARIASALTITWRAHGDAFTTAPRQFGNLVLDLTGSDHRPLVDLLLAVGPVVRARLETPPPHASWETRRAPLVHHLVATRFLQPDVARWLVDAWGAALDLAPVRVVEPTLARIEAPESARTGVSTGAAPRPSATVPFAPTIASRAAVAPAAATVNRGTRPTSALTPPSWAGGPSALRVGARAKQAAALALLHGAGTVGSPAMARPVPARWRTYVPPMSAAARQRRRQIELAAFALMGIAAIGVFIAAAVGLASRRRDAVAQSAVLPLAPERISRDVDSARIDTLRATPPQGQSTASTSSTVPADGAQLIAAGLGGRYRVLQHVRSVSGSSSCDRVAAALQNDRVSIEMIEHVPGTFAFLLRTRAVNGTLSGSADFDAGPRSGTTDGVSWVFRMRGQFTTTGFNAESWTTTRAIIRWGRTQTCLTIADLVGERLPA